MSKYKPKPRKPMELIPEETGCKSWTEVYQQILNTNKHLLKDDILYFNCRFGNSGSVPIFQIPTEVLESYCWREAHGEKAPQKEVIQLELFTDDKPF